MADTVITVGLIVAAGIIITDFGERNFFLRWCRAPQPAQYEVASGEVKTLFSDCTSPVLKTKMHPSLISFEPRPPNLRMIGRLLIFPPVQIFHGTAFQGKDTLPLSGLTPKSFGALSQPQAHIILSKTWALRRTMTTPILSVGKGRGQKFEQLAQVYQAKNRSRPRNLNWGHSDS